jgi:aminoglycoside phosphotransferase
MSSTVEAHRHYSSDERAVKGLLPALSEVAGWGQVLLDAYGTAPDDERTAYYRLLWDLSPE